MHYPIYWSLGFGWTRGGNLGIPSLERKYDAMPIKVTAGYFHVYIGIGEVEATATKKRQIAAGAATKVQDAEKIDQGFGVDQDNVSYAVSGAKWDAKLGVLTGIMWKLRDRKLPARMHNRKASRLDIGHDDLGEGAAFAYSPAQGKVVIEYNHEGPRHGVFATFLMKVSDQVASLTPIPTKDALQRMQNADLIRKIEFRLDGDGSKEELDALEEGAPRTVGRAIRSMRDMGGPSIKVTISMGHHSGGLSEGVAALAEMLATFGGPVKAIKAGIKDEETVGIQLLDLMGGRLKTVLEVPEAGRAVNHLACANALKNLIHHLN